MSESLVWFFFFFSQKGEQLSVDTTLDLRQITGDNNPPWGQPFRSRQRSRTTRGSNSSNSSSDLHKLVHKCCHLKAKQVTELQLLSLFLPMRVRCRLDWKQKVHICTAGKTSPKQQPTTMEGTVSKKTKQKTLYEPLNPLNLQLFPSQNLNRRHLPGTEHTVQQERSLF